MDPQSRTFPVIYQVDNRDRSVAIHQAVYVRLLTNAASVAPAVPESALVDDGGRPVIFIQAVRRGIPSTAGKAWDSRRRIRPGARRRIRPASASSRAERT